MRREDELMDLKQLKKLAEGATPGPWDAEQDFDQSCGKPCTQDGCHDSHASGTWSVWGPEHVDHADSWRIEKADAQYIAAVSPDVVLELLEGREIQKTITVAEMRRSMKLRAALKSLKIGDCWCDRLSKISKDGVCAHTPACLSAQELFR